ncbi:hypothetical protein BDV59DRAFT_167553 [Aspergillus ambiguus]|uniref:tRNA (uracil) methyltransferase n=1 Tax=Aspergillus ambiguus TaxID=176160 RepID=UPI003CCDD792
MGNARNKNPRNVALLSGKPLADTIEASTAIITEQEEWVTSKDLTEPGLPHVPEVMHALNLFLLGNINVNSSHLYRADILHDSLGLLKTPQQKEQTFVQTGNSDLVEALNTTGLVEPLPARDISGFTLTRTVVRRLIPRNPKLDRPIEQTCHFYEEVKIAPVSGENGDAFTDGKPTEISLRRDLLVYSPHIKSKEDIPYYHPMLQALAYLYEYKHEHQISSDEKTSAGTLSLHFVLYPGEPVPTRLERTLHILLNNQIRLARTTYLSEDKQEEDYNPNKDNIVPRHLVQNTYLRLKLKYASDLCKRWVENTDPSKHVFEDLSITAFLIELWRNMYGVVPADEQKDNTGDSNRNFPGFVDVACGNGVLVYVLLMEGYQGWGFDARRRKTWSIFPDTVQARLKEEIYIPKPFVDALTASGLEGELHNLGVGFHSGMFPKDTFIISNHADELTPWTPLMAAQAHPESPSPFIAIPCCSHSLSGARYRYPPPKAQRSTDANDTAGTAEVEQNPQPASGDLKALRKDKKDEQSETVFYKSMYGALTAKTMSISEEIGCEVEKTILRIPSTRNMGVIGGRRAATDIWRKKLEGSDVLDIAEVDGEAVVNGIMEVVHRECLREGGVSVAARIWTERAKCLHLKSGKGKGNGH